MSFINWGMCGIALFSRNLPSIRTSAELPVNPCSSNTARFPASNVNGFGGTIFMMLTPLKKTLYLSFNRLFSNIPEITACL